MPWAWPATPARDPRWRTLGVKLAIHAAAPGPSRSGPRASLSGPGRQLRHGAVLATALGSRALFPGHLSVGPKPPESAYAVLSQAPPGLLCPEKLRLGVSSGKRPRGCLVWGGSGVEHGCGCARYHGAAMGSRGGVVGRSDPTPPHPTQNLHLAYGLAFRQDPLRLKTAKQQEQERTERT